METYLKLVRQLADGHYHSGEVLAERLGLSRAAVWKAARKAGERLGLTIESRRGTRPERHALPGGAPVRRPGTTGPDLGLALWRQPLSVPAVALSPGTWPSGRTQPGGGGGPGPGPGGCRRGGHWPQVAQRPALAAAQAGRAADRGGRRGPGPEPGGRRTGPQHLPAGYPGPGHRSALGGPGRDPRSSGLWPQPHRRPGDGGQRYDRYRGERVEIRQGERHIIGTQAGITAEGALRVEMAGEIRFFTAGEISLRPAVSPSP